MEQIVENNKKIVAPIAIIVIVILIAYYYFSFVSTSDIGNKADNKNKTVNKDLVRIAKSEIQEIGEAELLAKQGQYKAALDKYDIAMSKADNASTTAIIDVSRASVYFMMNDNSNALESLIRIGGTANYPAIVRAVALNRILLQYSGTKNKDLLKAFDTDVSNATDTYSLQLKAYTQIYNIYPLGGPVSFLAIDGIKNTTDINKIKQIYNDAILKIEADILFQNRGIGSNYIVPNLILAKIRLMKEVIKYDIVKKEDVYKEYERAIDEAKIKLQNITESFAALEYLDYLSINNGDKDKQFYAFNLIRTKPLPEMVQTNLKSKNSKLDWSGIVKYMSVNKEAKEYFSKYGL